MDHCPNVISRFGIADIWITSLLVLGACSVRISGQCGDYNGGNHDCGYGAGPQNWFGPYYLGRNNPYGFLSSVPIGYGSGAMPFFSGEFGVRGTSLGPGGYLASSFAPSSPYIPPQNFY